MSDPLDPIFQQEEQRKLRAQLFWRLGIAALVLGGALGGIIWLEQQQTRSSAATTPTPGTPRIAPPIATPTPAPTPIEASSTATAEASTASAVQASAPTAISTGTPLPTSSQPPAITPRATNTPHPTPAANSTGKAGPAPAPTSKAATQPRQTIPLPTPDTTPALSAAPFAASTPFSVSERKGSYTVQAGVFLHAAKAEKLLDQLQRAGIPAYLETRVQIGPFRNKAEADAAIRKLRSMGIDPVVRTQ